MNSVKRKQPAGVWAALLAAILACMLLYPQSSSGYESTSWAMGSYVQQTLYGTGAEEAASETASAVTEGSRAWSSRNARYLPTDMPA